MSRRDPPLRVALLSDATPGRNGVGVYYDDLLVQLRDRVEDVLLVAPPVLDDDSFPGLRFPMPGDRTQSLFLPSLPWVWRTVRNFRPNVIVSGTPWIFGVMGIPLARETNAALCFGYHTQYDRLADLYWSGPLTRHARPLFRWWDRLVFRCADRVLVHNGDLMETAQDAKVGAVDLVGTPVASSFVADLPPPPPEELGSVLFVGRLAPEKEVGQVLEAAEAHPDVTFRVAGEGPESDAIREAADRLGNLEHLGWVERERIIELLDGSDLMVLPSRFETFGTAAYEAMLRRRLVLVTQGVGLVCWAGLREGVFMLREGEKVAHGMTRLRNLTGAERAERAETAFRAARAHNHETMEHWLQVLRTAVRNRRR